MDNYITVTSPGISFATGTTATASPLPLDSSGKLPIVVRIAATVPTYVCLTTPSKTAAVAGDMMVQPGDAVVLNTAGFSGISAILPSGTGVLEVSPIENGGIGSSNPSLLDLNFTTATSLDARITFTRADATTCATYFNSSGVLSTAAANVPRFDYDPATLLPRGLLIEESRTNLLLQSRDMTQAVWGAAGVFTNATAARNAVGLDGSANTANTITTSNTLHAVYQNITVTASTQYTFSFYAKRGTMTDMKYSVYDGTNLADIVAPTSYYSQTDSAGGWKRITVTFTTPVGCLSVRVYPLRDSGVPGTAIFDMCQLEAGAFITSAIPTTTATVTRAADSASMTGTNFSSWFNASAGTFVTKALLNSGLPNGLFPVVAEVSDGTANNRMQVFAQTGATDLGGMRVDVAGVAQANTTAVTTVAKGVAISEAFAYAANDFAASVNGGTVVVDASGSLPTPSQMNIGASSTPVLYARHIQRITYYNTRLPNATLQSLTV